MIRYIEINQDNEIIDLFCDYQKPKMRSQSKIEFDEVDHVSHKINGKSISQDDGIPIFTWDGSIVTEVTDFDSDERFISANKQRIRDQLRMADLAMVRVIDDILGYIIDGTPIPQIVKNKLAERIALRDQL